MNPHEQPLPGPRPRGLGVLLLVPLLPLLGARFAGRDLHPIFQFPPPLQIPVDYPRFSAVACGLVLCALMAFVIPWLRVRPAMADERQIRRGDLPRWGWFAVAWTCGWWLLAWSRFEWFAPLQPYTFFPLWFGFVVTTNGLTVARTGSCLLTRAPRAWLQLFAISAVFWWGFEWLNRFVQNWHYLGAARFGPWAYAIHATICFSTVLPAVASVAECVASLPLISRRAAAGPRWRALASRRVASALIAGAILGLFATGIWPRQFYSTLWAAPLALLLGEAILRRRRGAAEEMARGDWRHAGTWILAALICGFWWEMWNWHSQTKWIYTVPYVDRWHVFEMPLLGYVGYLPFGLECLLVVERTLGPAVTRYPPAPPDRCDRAG